MRSIVSSSSPVRARRLAAREALALDLEQLEDAPERQPPVLGRGANLRERVAALAQPPNQAGLAERGRRPGAVVLRHHALSDPASQRVH